MASLESTQVTGPGGLRGSIDASAWPVDSYRAQVLVRFEDKTTMLVPREALVQQGDGSYYLALDAAVWERRGAPAQGREPPLVLPVLHEVLNVHPRPVETGRVRIRKTVHEHEEVVDPPLLRSEVVIERVPVNRVVEGPISAHSEEDTLIIPVLEEVLVVEKRLLLKEEVRITTRRVETHAPKRVVLRREEATVERSQENVDANKISTT
jgi:uncharacterized protein (TIGR02271 family)